MGKYIQKRLVGMIVLLFLVSIAAFALVRLMPGDAAFAYLNSINAPVTDAALAKVRAELGLDRPVIFQYTAWLRRVVCLDLGVSFMTKKSVSGQLLISFRYTMILTAMSAVWIAVLSLPLGIMAGKRPGSAGDQLIRGIMFLGSSMPSFWLGFLLVELFALKLKLLPVQGAETFSHLVLPSATLACSYIAMYTKMIRGGIVENMGRRYAVQGKGPEEEYSFVETCTPKRIKSCIHNPGIKSWKYAVRSCNCRECVCLAGNGEADCQRCCWKGLSGHPGIYTGDCGGIYTA